MKNMLSIHKTFLLIFTTMLLIFMAGCGTQSDNGQAGENTTGGSSEKTTSQSDKPSSEDNPIVTITMENDKKITIEMYPEVAPNTVANFISLVEKGFYDGLTFHRVIPGFMIQGGDPAGNGSGGPEYSIKGEFSSNGFENNLKHVTGVISMARAQDPDSAGSQFFIMVADAPHLDGQYAAFGKVIEGMDVVNEIVSVKRDPSDKPLVEQKMKTVTVDTKGHDFPKPEIIK